MNRVPVCLVLNEIKGSELEEVRVSWVSPVLDAISRRLAGVVVPNPNLLFALSQKK